MQPSKKSGVVLVFFGIAFIAGALVLIWRNECEQKAAQQMSSQIMEQMKQMQADGTASLLATNSSDETQMPEMQINGERYIGWLNIPELQLELPVQSDWNYQKLKETPCRYSGSVQEENLVIMGHDYKRHFGKLRNLPAGAEVKFQDTLGSTKTYTVAGVETVSPQKVEEVVSSEYELTLFTCTYSGKNRTVVRCTAEDAL